MVQGRLPKSGDNCRIHTHIPPAWRREIDKAAKGKNVSRSHYVASAAYAQAVKDNKATAKSAA